MRCVAVIEAERPGLDSVILWDRDGTLIAFAYEDGKVKMTRPLNAENLDQAIEEARQAFQINAGQLTRITDWQDTSQRSETFGPVRTRW